MTRETELAVGEIYHIYNRGVDGRKIFLEEAHFQRFYESMYLFNDINFEDAGGGWNARMAELNTMRATGCDIRKRLVDILAFNLMDNHVHMGLIPLVEDGISVFMHKLQMSYSKFINLELERSGSLVDRPFKSKHVDNPAYADFLPIYIHGNSWDRFGIKWREGEIENWEEALRRLDQHKWSSHGVAMRRPQDLPVVEEKYLHDAYVSVEDYLNHLRQWGTRYRDQLKEIEGFVGA